jgi:hypothetical protein
MAEGRECRLKTRSRATPRRFGGRKLEGKADAEAEER